MNYEKNTWKALLAAGMLAACSINEKGKVTNVQATSPDNSLYPMKEEAVAVMNRMTLPISFQIVE